MKRKRAVGILEEDKTPQFEMKLAKKTGGKWTELPSERHTTSAVHYEGDLRKITEEKPYSLLHTHPKIEPDTKVKDASFLIDEEFLRNHRTMGASGKLEVDENATHELIHGLREGTTLPSIQDITRILEEEKYTFMEIAQRDPVTGKVAGYYFVKKTKDTPHIPLRPYGLRGEEYEKAIENWRSKSEVKKFSDIFKSVRYKSRWLPGPHSGEKFTDKQRYDNQKAFDELTQKLSLRVRYVPTKGYEYVQGFGFVKNRKEDRKRTLEHRVAVVIMFMSLAASLLFLSISITGNAIAHLSQERSNIIGGFLFLIGIFAAFFYLRGIVISSLRAQFFLYRFKQRIKACLRK